MKRKLLVVLMMCVFLLAGCGGAGTADTDNMEDRTIDAVMASEAAFIAEDGSEVLLNEYECMEGVLMDPVRYAYVDFDADGTDEAVISFSEYDEWMLVLHKEGNPVYGYAFDIRTLNNLKADGSFIQSSGAEDSEFCKMSFSEGTYEVETVTYEGGAEERAQLEDVEWTDF